MRRLSYLFSAALRRLSLLVAMIVVTGFGAVSPQFAAAEAVAGPESLFGGPGLPDGRGYEQASASLKPGTEAGSPVNSTPPFIAAEKQGDGVLFYKSGPIGEAATGFDFFSFANRSNGGWLTRGAYGRGLGEVQGVGLTTPISLGFSAGMNASVFTMRDVALAEQEGLSGVTPDLYYYAEDGKVQWLGKPQITEPPSWFRGGANDANIAGASPDLKTVYYSYQGALTRAEEEPDPALGNISHRGEILAMNEGGTFATSNMGFYEWHDGALEYAGVLPDGQVDPWGAIPANIPSEAYGDSEFLGNEVSEDGSKAFFVSPDPGSSSGRPRELYVRETAPDGTHRSVLVSRDTLLPESGGLPAAAPSGVVVMNGASKGYMYASPDGSRVFFESTDQLTPDAPGGGSFNAYEFDLETERLAYLPDVAVEDAGALILKVSSDGSSFLFEREDIEKKEGRLYTWSDGQVSEIGNVTGWPAFEQGRPVTIARFSRSGSIVAFQAKAPFTALNFNNGGGGHTEVYRYDLKSNVLSCVSCPPQGTAVTGDASLSNDFASIALAGSSAIVTGNRGVSEGGDRVFYDTPDAVLGQDTNGVRDVYEWDNGTVRLISTGVSDADSFFGDNSANGDDVFFSTSEGLVPDDTDLAYDVYDARVPRPGDTVPPTSVPCEGSVCQGPPSVPELFAPPASETFNGSGDVVQPLSAKAGSKALTRKQRLERALRACTHKRDKRGRAVCKRRARKLYGGANAAGSRSGRTGGSNYGRGK